MTTSIFFWIAVGFLVLFAVTLLAWVLSEPTFKPTEAAKPSSKTIIDEVLTYDFKIAPGDEHLVLYKWDWALAPAVSRERTFNTTWSAQPYPGKGVI